MTLPFKYCNDLINNFNIFNIIEFKKVLDLTYDNIDILQNGKITTIVEQRGTSWLSDSDLTFEYSGKIMKPKKIPEIIKNLKLIIENKFNIVFDGILVNYYPNGNSSMGYHSDPVEDKWDTNFVVISFGDIRQFVFRKKDNKDIKYNYELNNGDLIYMFNNCQDKYEHSVRKNKKSNNERISFVFKKKSIHFQ
jgi:alkylated DNA repair dioxygenase AlkB|tara:strand:+ start:270 stop:848 length:579 start_codon:yes stop_codon:yes gene_type:complete